MDSQSFIVTAEVVLCAPPASALAQAWPARPAEIYTPLSGGQGPAVRLRNIADKMSATLGPSAVTENKPGASGSVAFRAAKAAPAGG